MLRKRHPSPGEAVADLRCACAAARRAARALSTLYDGWLRASRIEAPQFALLAMLDRRGPCTHTTIGRMFSLDKTTLSRNLKVLERQGWIDVVPGDDARERRVSLTPAGRRQLAAARPAWRRAQAQLRTSIGARGWKAMFGVFQTITQAARVAARSHKRRSRAPSLSDVRSASRHARNNG